MTIALHNLPAAAITLIRKDIQRSVAVKCGTKPVPIPVSHLLEGPISEGTTPPPTLLYEVFRQYDDRLILFPDHLRRYEASFRHLYPTVACEGALLAVSAAVESLLEAHRAEFPIRQNIKILSWGPTPEQCLCYYIRSSYPPDEWYTTGIRAGLLVNADRGSNPNDKVVQADLRLRATTAQACLSAFEVLLLHGGEADPLVPEGSRSNFILVKGAGSDAVVESSMDEDILIGITLLAVKRECAAAGIPFHQRKLRLSDVLQADAVAMLGTSVGVLPIKEVVVGLSELPNLPPFAQGAFTPSGEGVAVHTKRSNEHPLMLHLQKAYTATTF